MIKTFGLTTIAAAVLLTGCGGGGGTSENNTPTTIETAQNKLIGTWIDGNYAPMGCNKYNNETKSEKVTFTFSLNDLEVDFFEYNNTTCNPNGIITNTTETFSYQIEGTDKATTGQTSYKMSVIKTGVSIKIGTVTDPEILQTGKTAKDEFIFDGDHLVFSEDEESNNTQYSNDFNLSEYFIKLP